LILQGPGEPLDSPAKQGLEIMHGYESARPLRLRATTRCSNY